MILGAYNIELLLECYQWLISLQVFVKSLYHSSDVFGVYYIQLSYIQLPTFYIQIYKDYLTLVIVYDIGKLAEMFLILK